MINLVLILNIVTILVCLPMNLLILIQFFKKISSYNKKGVTNYGKNKK